MMHFEKGNLSSLDEPRRTTNKFALMIFSLFMIAYIGISIFAVITDVPLKEQPITNSSDNFQNFTRDFKKAANIISNEKLNYGGILIMSILLTTMVNFFITRMTPTFSIIVGIVINILHIVLLVTNGFLFDITSIILMIWNLYVGLYAFNKYGTKLMNEMIEESFRFVMKFPLTIVFSTFVSILLAAILVLAFYVNFKIIDISLFNNNYTLCTNLLLVLHIIGTIWVIWFIILLAHFIISHLFGVWYNARNKSSVSNFMIFKSIGLTLRYHMGTIAYSTSIWAIFRLIISMIKGIKNRTIRSSHNSFVTVMSWIYILFQLNFSSAVVTAINGQSFKKSTDKACQLILRYPLRFFAVSNGAVWFTYTLIFLYSIVIGVFIYAFSSVLDHSNLETGVKIALLFIYSFCIIFIVFFPYLIALCAALISLLICSFEDYDNTKTNIKPKILDAMEEYIE